MKHPLKPVIMLLSLFLLAHLLGLYIVSYYGSHELPYIERPVLEQQTAFIPLFIGLLLVTLLAYALLKWKVHRLWRVWFFFSLFFCLTISFTVFFPSYVALTLALVLGYLKVWKNHFLVHNISEVFVYGGLVAVFAPLFTVLSVSIFLLLVSLYDMYAVWRSKHMITMAKYQSQAHTFAGIVLPYTRKKKIQTAIIGGGDIAFTLLFSSVLWYNYSLFAALLSSVLSVVALGLLFYFAERKKFYPAMPFLSLGCFLALLIVTLL